MANFECKGGLICKVSPQGGDSARKPTGGLGVFLGGKIFTLEVFFRGLSDAKYFLGCLHIPGIFFKNIGITSSILCLH